MQNKNDKDFNGSVLASSMQNKNDKDFNGSVRESSMQNKMTKILMEQRRSEQPDERQAQSQGAYGR